MSMPEPEPGAENAYGFRRRLAFASRAIQGGGAASVLDLGCGSGAYLLAPLARRFPHVAFTGVDSDSDSVAAARRDVKLPNLWFHLTGEWPREVRHDLVIASEVIEHVESPPEFLAQILASLASGGRLLLTLPNGYGAAELAGFAQSLLTVAGVLPLLQSIKRSVVPATPAEGPRDSYAVSPHINFFSHAAILGLLRESGFRVLEFQPRSLLCGFVWDLLVRGERMAQWNQRAVDSLPPAFAADWMFLLEPGGEAAPRPFSRGVFSRLRRRLNEKAAGIA
ncbi:MAG: class I SAM-dependent methyltransferase [Betaproteobacteria bacterium]